MPRWQHALSTLAMAGQQQQQQQEAEKQGSTGTLARSADSWSPHGHDSAETDTGVPGSPRLAQSYAARTAPFTGASSCGDEYVPDQRPAWMRISWAGKTHQIRVQEGPDGRRQVTRCMCWSIRLQVWRARGVRQRLVLGNTSRCDSGWVQGSTS